MKLCVRCGAVMPDEANTCPVCSETGTVPLLSRQPEPEGSEVPEGVKKRRRFDLRLYTAIIAVLLALAVAAMPFLLRDAEKGGSGHSNEWISLDEGRYPMP